MAEFTLQAWEKNVVTALQATNLEFENLRLKLAKDHPLEDTATFRFELFQIGMQIEKSLDELT